MDINGMIMMDSGGGVTGTWINRRTNDVISVRDCIFEGERMLIQTFDGRQIEGEEFTRDYYQVSSANEDPEKIIKQVTTSKVDPMFEGMAELALEEPAKRPSGTSKAQERPGGALKTDEDILDKIFKDCTLSYRIELDVRNLPREAISVVNKYMNISAESIADYIARKITRDSGYLRKQIEDLLEDAAS